MDFRNGGWPKTFRISFTKRSRCSSAYHHFAGPRSAPTEKVRLPERHTQMAKEVVGSRDVEEEVRKRESQQITTTCENPLSISELRDQHGVCICFECGRWHRPQTRYCRANSRLHILQLSTTT